MEEILTADKVRRDHGVWQTLFKRFVRDSMFSKRSEFPSFILDSKCLVVADNSDKGGAISRLVRKFILIIILANFALPYKIAVKSGDIGIVFSSFVNV